MMGQVGADGPTAAAVVVGGSDWEEGRDAKTKIYLPQRTSSLPSARFLQSTTTNSPQTDNEVELPEFTLLHLYIYKLRRDHAAGYR